VGAPIQDMLTFIEKTCPYDDSGKRQPVPPYLEEALGKAAGSLSSATEVWRGVDGIIYFLADLSVWLGDNEPGWASTRKLREVGRDLAAHACPRTIIFCERTFQVPASMQDEVRVVSLPLPTEAELAEMVSQGITEEDDLHIPVEEAISQFSQALAGLTVRTAESALMTAFAAQVNMINHETVGLVVEEKKSIVRRAGLEYLDSLPISAFGGYEKLVERLVEYQWTFTPEAREQGVVPAKGVFLVGPPGTGKSTLARVVTGLANRPGLTMSMGTLIGSGGGILGQASTAMHDILRIVETLKPTLFIDEFEKAARGLGSTDSGSAGDEVARVLADFLGWMADQEGSFIIATGNSVEGLRPEQFRNGRFSEVLYMGLPSAAGQEAIFAAQINLAIARRSAKLAPVRFEDFDCAALAQVRPKELSGADIATAVQAAQSRAARERRPFTQADIMDALDKKHLKSIVDTSGEQVKRIEEWAKTNGLRTDWDASDESDEQDAPVQVAPRASRGGFGSRARVIVPAE
jgi:ATP-dependent 26S proteasome regulatory subunit